METRPQLKRLRTLFGLCAGLLAATAPAAAITLSVLPTQGSVHIGNVAEIQFHEHMTWLVDVLANPERAVYIGEHNGAAVGTVRADVSNGVCELSWTVAPEFRGQGFGTEMVALLAMSIPGPIRAEVKRGNAASIRIAEAAGMCLEKEDEGVLHFLRGPVAVGTARYNVPGNPHGYTTRN